MSPLSNCLHVVAGKLQAIIGAATLADVDSAEAAFGQLVDKLPSGSTAQERLLLRGLLLEFASRGGTALHARFHPRSHSDGCKFQENELLVRFLSRASDDPCEAFRRWAFAFLSELHRHHPSSAARQAARLMRRKFRFPLNIEALALQVHSTPAQLRRSFQLEFGMQLREYIASVRVLAVLERVMDEKAEVLALEIGYGSKKNFYRLFRQLTSLTPTEFRALSEERREHLIDIVRDRLRRRTERPTS